MGLIQRLYEEVWNQGNLDVADELYIPGWEGWASAGGIEGFKQFVCRQSQCFPQSSLHN